MDKAAVHIKAGDVPFSQIWRIPASDNSDSVTLVDSRDNDRFEEANVTVAGPRVARHVHR